jgi:hypothetical protein
VKLSPPSRNLGLLCLLFVVLAASSAELKLEGNRLLVIGMLDGSAVTAFADQLASGRVRTVVFEDSFGGSAGTAEAYASAIRASGVQTEVRGQCHAACAYAFLAGKSHRFSLGFQINGLLIPVTMRPKPEELAIRWRDEEAANRTLAEFTGSRGAAPAAVVPAGTPAALPLAQTPHEGWQPDQGVLFTSTPTLFGRIHNAFYCDGTQGRDYSKCELLSDADPFLLGVLTP